MSDEENNKNKLFLTLILSIIASVLMIIFTIPKAYAFELISPDSTITLSGTTYYGYNLPTRVNNSSTAPNNYVDIGLNTFDQIQHFPTKVARYKKNTYTTYSFANSTLDNYLSDHNLSSLNFNRNLTEPISYNNILASAYNLSFSFHPGEQGDPLSDGFHINYNDYYSYSFDVIVYSENGGLNNSYTLNATNTGQGTGFTSSSLNNNNTCLYIGQIYTYNDQEYFSYNCRSSNVPYLNISRTYVDDHLQIVHFDIPFNDYTKGRFGGLEDYSGNNEYITPFRANMLFSPMYLLVNHLPTDSALWKDVQVYISEPYDITLWRTNSDEYCQDECWTQEQTDEFNDSRVSDTDSFINNLLSQFTAITNRDYGFSGIINLTFSFLSSVISSASPNTCYTYQIPVLSTTINLPCGNSFWNRNDVLNFKAFYEMLQIGIVSYFVAWKIYRDLINLLTPNSKIIDGKEVDSL